MLRAALAAVALVVLVTGSVIAGTAPAQDRPGEPVLSRLAAHTHWLATSTSVLAGAPDQVAEGVAGKLLAAAPVVVVSRPDRPASLAAAATVGPAGARAAAADRRRRRTRGGRHRASLPARPVPRCGRRSGTCVPRPCSRPAWPGQALAAELPGIHVVSSPAALPATSAATPALSHLALLVRSGNPRRRDAGGGHHRAGGGRPGDRRATAATRARTRPPSPRSGPPSPGRCSPSGPASGRPACWRPGSRSPGPGSSCPAAARSCSPVTWWSPSTAIPALRRSASSATRT